jgi:autotransporter adhesin
MIYHQDYNNRVPSVTALFLTGDRHMSKKTNAVDAPTITATKTQKVSLRDRLESLKAQADAGDPILQGAMGAVDLIEAEAAEAKVAQKKANKKLRGIINALSK